MTTDLVTKFKDADISGFPDFYLYKNPLEQGLWVLWVTKEKLGIKILSAEQIASIIRDTKEISIDARSIINSFCRAKDKIHTYKENAEAHFEIMKPGKDHLRSFVKEGYVEIFYFEPGKPYSNKRVLSKDILSTIKGESRIVDPYCNIKTLDIVKEVKSTKLRFLVRTENLRDKKARFIQQLRDFKIEYPHIELRDYPHDDIHDRYIISSDGLIILGHSIKDLGNKESFAISLNKNAFKNLIEAISESFDTRWKQAQPL
jgi:hypothetical protein